MDKFLLLVFVGCLIWAGIITVVWIIVEWVRP